MAYFRIFLFVSLLLSWVGQLCAAEAEKVAVIYPEAKEPYRSIYQDIIAGVLATDVVVDKQVELKPYALPKTYKIDVVTNGLRREGIRRVIALGRIGYKLAKRLPKEFCVISGGMPFAPNGVSGISLMSNPVSLFNYLSQVAPEVNTIHVAYSQKSDWLIELAKSAAKTRGLQLNLNKVSSIKEAIQFYHQLFESNVSRQDAIWLPLDRISSHDKTILPLILEKAWSKEVVVFSSKPSHAKRGALFSTYPDNFKLGQHLLTMVMAQAEKPEQKQFAALSSLQLAVNLRTAAHLGLKYSSEQQQQFKLTFPE